MRAFIAELRRRKVLHVAAIYAAVGWLLVQVVATIFPYFGAPAWVVRFAMVLIFAGLPAAVVFSWFYELSSKGFVATDDLPDSDGSARRPRSRLVIAAFAGASMLVVFAGAGWWVAQRAVSDLPNEQADEATRSDLPSLAVLPFENRSPDPENAFFADGVQDEILARLAKIGSLKVVSRASTRGYGPNPENLPKVGTELGVAHLLQGSVQRSGKLVRVNVQLVEARSQTARWAEVYDREVADALTVQSQIAGSVARSLNAQLTQAEQSALATAPTANPAAYDAYLRGRIFQSRAEITAGKFKNAIRQYEEAVRLDPNFALAWAQMSVMHGELFVFGFDPSQTRLKLAENAAATATRLAPDLGETFLARGYVRYYGHSDYPGALDLFVDAAKRMPNDAGALMAQSYVLRRQGQFDQALAMQTSAAEVDPRNTEVLYELVGTLVLFPNRLNEALSVTERVLNLAPDDPDLIKLKGAIHVALGNGEVAEKIFAAHPPESRELLLFVSYIQHLLQQRQGARAIQVLKSAMASHNPDDGPLLGELHVLLAVAQRLEGDREGAAASCENAIADLKERRRQSADSKLDFPLSLAELHAGLGHRAEAMAELDLADKQLAKDFKGKPDAWETRARVEILLGNPDAALKLLQTLIKARYHSRLYVTTLTAAHLRNDPAWDPLRKDPRFAALLVEADREGKEVEKETAKDPSVQAKGEARDAAS